MRRSAPSSHCYGYLAWTHTHTHIVHLGWSRNHLCVYVCDSACIRSRAAAALPNSPRKDIWGAVLSLITAYAHSQRLSIIHMKPFVLYMHWCTQKHLAQPLDTHKDKVTMDMTQRCKDWRCSRHCGDGGIFHPSICVCNKNTFPL